MVYEILNWMDGSRESFTSEKKAIKNFDEQKKEAIKNEEEFDKSCYKVLKEFNNINQ